MAAKEAKARIKINKLLEDAGWRLLDNDTGKANVIFENNVKITQQLINELGENYEKVKNELDDMMYVWEKATEELMELEN